MKEAIDSIFIPGSPEHTSWQQCYEHHAQSESFKEILRSGLTWLKEFSHTPSSYTFPLAETPSLSCQPQGYVLINGRYVPHVSTSVDGVVALSLKEAKRALPTFIQKYDMAKYPLAFINSLCSQDEGLVLYIPEGTVIPSSIEIQHIGVANSQTPVICSPKIVLILGKQAVCSVKVSHHCEGEGQVIVNGVTELFVSQQAEIALTMTPKYHQEERVSWSHIATIEEKGACVVQQQLTESVDGYGCFDHGFSLTGTQAHAELLVATHSPKKTWVRNLMYHDAESTTSRQTIRSVLESGYFAFEGGIHITSQGMFSDAYQKHDGMLLSDEAKIMTFPRLEILTDDVKASHGATVGPLDAYQMFYLQSRGIGKEEAQRSLVEGFLVVEPSYESFPKLFRSQSKLESAQDA